MAIWKKKKRESRGELESEYAKLAKEKERLELKKELREREREIRKLKHPHLEETGRTAKRAGGRILGFAGGLAKESVRSYSKTKHTLRTKRIRGQPPRLRSRSFAQPTGDDISLSGSIARADWSGGKNVMNTEFFGSDMGHQEKDFFGTPKKENLINQKKKNNYF